MIPLCSLEYSDVYLFRDQKHLGRVVVALKEHKDEMVFSAKFPLSVKRYLLPLRQTKSIVPCMVISFLTFTSM